MIRCKECDTALIGHAVKSGKFFYYMCGNARRRGRGVCQTPILPKDRIEQFVTDRIKQYILTEENLEELVSLTNEELAQTCDDERERLQLLETQQPMSTTGWGSSTMLSRPGSSRAASWRQG